jgi:membrane-associated phospholipid phosphatase
MSPGSSLMVNWKNFLKDKRKRVELFLTVIILAAVLISFSQLLLYIEARRGIVLSDPILKLFSPIDLTWLTFALIYLSLIMAIIELVKTPHRLLLALQCYGLMIVIRALAMYLTPFEAPSTLLPLDDPFVQLFGEGNILEKDLFFSGHTATLFLLSLLMKKRNLKLFFLILTMLVGTSVILQHVHYSIDVFAAPFFAYSSYRIIISFNKNKEGNEQ